MIHPSYFELMDIVNKDVKEGEKPIVTSRYSIVLATAKRARQLIAAGVTNYKDKEEKPLSIAVDELEHGDIHIIRPEEAERLREERAQKKALAEAAAKAAAERASEEETAGEAEDEEEASGEDENEDQDGQDNAEEMTAEDGGSAENAGQDTADGE